jgi:hypothetical protein
MLRRIIRAIPLKNRIVRLEYADGARVDVDFAPIIREGGVFGPLGRDEIFSQVTVASNGRSISWPDDVDFCADALWKTGTSSPAPQLASES